MNDREYQKQKGNKILKRAGVVIRSITYRTLDGVLYFDDEYGTESVQSYLSRKFSK